MSPKQSDKSKSGPSAKYSVFQCPKGMAPEEWQRALRRQAASSQYFCVKAPVEASYPFVVSNPESNRKYRVWYYGGESSFNRCECMDFKTSRLGTCKHIEAISLASNGKYARRAYGAPTGVFVYVDYVDGRKVKIHIGASAPEEMRSLAATLFDNDGVLKDMACDPSPFIRRAQEISETFEWESDAMDLVIECRDKERRKRILAEKYASSNFDGLIKTTLHPYQAEGVRFAFAGGRTINADEMGLGKTVQAIAVAELLRREGLADSVIIICPTSLKYQWLAEINRFTDSAALVVEGNVVKRGDQLSNPDYFYKICSFHAMSNSIKSGYVPQADMVVYDELQRLKNRETQMGKQLRKLSSGYVMALSGTPLENKLDELYSVTQLVDQFVLGPYYRFKSETTLTDDTGKVVGYRNLHAVAERLRHTMIRRKKADVRLQMPSRTDTNLYVPLTKEQRAIHDEYKHQVSIIIEKWRRYKFLSEADRKRLLLFLSMMRMVCDSTFILDQKTRHDTKIDEAMAIISNLLAEGDGKVVIFSQWERMLRILSQELEKEGVDFCFLNGGVPSPKRKGLIDRFREDPQCRIFLSTDAGATGLNLQSASLLVNIDLPWNPAVLEQRIARIYRLGQKNPVQIINMVARDTIEERMLSTLKFKSSMAAGILDGGDDAVFVENSKFKQIIEVVDDVVNENDAPSGISPQDAAAAPRQDASGYKTTDEKIAKSSDRQNSDEAPAGDLAQNTEKSNLDIVKSEGPKNGGSQAETHAGNAHIDGSQRNASEQAPKPSHAQAAAGEKDGSADARRAISEGLSALGKIAEVLRQPQGARALADALVKEDAETGQASINIPVADKATVVNILSAFAAFINR